MDSIPSSELAKVTYLDAAAVAGRTILLMALWDGDKWHQWVPQADGSLIELQMRDAALSNYVAKAPAREDDLHIPFLHFMWQRVSWAEVSRLTLRIGEDLHLMATSAAKLRHFFDTRHAVDNILLRSFVQTEVEYLLTVSRACFDLLQEAISALWNNHVRLLDPDADRKRKRHKLPKAFSDVVLEKGAIRSAEALVDRYAFPPNLAEQYAKYGRFFLSLRSTRDAVVHGGTSLDMIFVTPKGFCVDPKMKGFSTFEWTAAHRYNENIVALIPWVAHTIFETLGACTDLMVALGSVIQFPSEIAPGYLVFRRDPANKTLVELQDVIDGKLLWWGDEEAGSAANNPPSDRVSSSRDTTIPKDRNSPALQGAGDSK